MRFDCFLCRWLLPETTQDEEVEDNFGNGFCAPTQKQLWNLFENPHHSKAAKVLIPIIDVTPAKIFCTKNLHKFNFLTREVFFILL